MDIELLSEMELAKRLRVSRDMVKDLTRRGVLPVVLLGPHTRRYYLPDVLAALRGGRS
jgi:hypothetical protein